MDLQEKTREFLRNYIDDLYVSKDRIVVEVDNLPFDIVFRIDEGYIFLWTTGYPLSLMEFQDQRRMKIEYSSLGIIALARYINEQIGMVSFIYSRMQRFFYGEFITKGDLGNGDK